MSNITKDDLKTTLALGFQVAKVDRNVAEYEKEILDRITETLQLTPVERAEIADTPLTISDAMAGLSGPEAREFLVKALCAIAYSDGIQHDAEMGFIQEVNATEGASIPLRPWQEWESYVEEVVDTLSGIS